MDKIRYIIISEYFNESFKVCRHITIENCIEKVIILSFDIEISLNCKICNRTYKLMLSVGY